MVGFCLHFPLPHPNRIYIYHILYTPRFNDLGLFVHFFYFTKIGFLYESVFLSIIACIMHFLLIPARLTTSAARGNEYKKK